MKPNFNLFTSFGLFLTLIASSAAIIGCSKSADKNSDQAYIWDCSSDIQSQATELNSIFPSIKALGLEETDGSLIGRVSKIIDCDSILVILDSNVSNKIFLFDAENGKFIKSFGQVGKGPGEYSSIEDITLDNDKGSIDALCDNNRVISYDFDGKVISEETLDFSAYGMEFFNDKFYFLSHDTDKSEIIVTDNQFNIVNSYFKNFENELPHQLLHPLCKSADGEIRFTRYLDNNIYKLNDEDSPTLEYTIDFGDKALTRDNVAGLDQQSVKEIMKTKRGQIKYFIEGPQKACIMFFDSNRPCISIFDKNTGTAQSYLATSLNDMDFPLASPLEFCIDGGLVFISTIDSTPKERLINPETEIGENPVLYILK